MLEFDYCKDCQAHPKLHTDIKHMMKDIEALNHKFDKAIVILVVQLVLIISGLGGVLINYLLERG